MFQPLAIDPARIAGSSQTGDYQLALGDAGTVLEVNKATGVTITVPANATVGFPIGTVVELFQLGAGQVTVAAAGGVTLRSDGAKVKTNGQYATIGLRKRGSDEWVLSGDLA